MYCTRKINDGIFWIGGNDRKISIFEGAIPIENGMAYNSYFADDDKTVVLDTVDAAVAKVFYENVDKLLEGRNLDYVIVNHMEPDHSASLEGLVLRHPELSIVGTSKVKKMMQQYVSFDVDNRFHEVKEKEKLVTGKHTFTFINAPMVHWPEVTVTLEESTGTLFSADAFGIFGAHDGNIFADSYDFESEWLPAARKYYVDIVGKYGKNTENVLAKMATLDCSMICPLHGYIIRKDLDRYIKAYLGWARYEPETKGVLMLYASPYDNTKNAVDILSGKLSEKGVERIKIMDVSCKDPMDILPEAFRFSNIVVASTTYNGEMFIKMQEALAELKSMSLSGRKISIIENGSWAPLSGKKIKAFFEEMKDMEFVGDVLTIKSSLKEEQEKDIDALAESIAQSL